MSKSFVKITPEQAHYYKPILNGDLAKAVAFTLTPSNEPGYEGWEDITYYQDSPFA
jgi:hypothetical protein